MIVKERDKLLLIRYSDLKGIDCMKEHIEVLNEKGYVWFGKIGSVPTKRFIKILEDNETKYLILNSKNETYFCNFDKVEYELPKNLDGVPTYYKDNFLDKGVKFSIFFKLLSIKKIDKELLNNLVVSSSANNLNNALKFSMSAHFLIRAINEFEV